MRPYRTGTSSGTRDAACCSRRSTGSVRSAAGSNMAWLSRGAVARAARPRAARSALVSRARAGSSWYRCTSGTGRAALDRREAGHLLKIGQVPMVADVAPRGVVGGGEVPRSLGAGAERLADSKPPLLALPDLTVQRHEVPACGDLPPEFPDQPGRRQIADQVGSLVRVGRKVEELVRVGRRVDELMPAPADHHDRRDRALGEVFRHDLIVVRGTR